MPPIIDSHVHFWDPSRLRYPWLETLPALKRSFLPADLPKRGDESFIFVEANCAPAEALEEVRFVMEALPSVAGIIAFVDLTNIRTRYLALDRLRPLERVVGVRHNIQAQPPGFALAPHFVSGVREVGRRGLTFDLCITAGQLAEVEQLVSQCPGTSFVLDHCGKPAIRDDAFETWADDLDRLAQHHNVSCKLSGLLTEARPDQRHPDAILPYAEQAVTSFGTSRLLYGSDWPVVNLACDLSSWRVFVDRFTGSWSADERASFYGGNATRLYNLRPHG